MRRILLVTLGTVTSATMEGLAGGIGRVLEAEPVLHPHSIDTRFAFHPERRQHHATEILAHLVTESREDTWRVLGVTAADLYIPILTFVFGEAQNPGRCAVVSTHRLRQEFYGLPGDGDLLARRLLTEASHELGHTMGLVHCAVHTCAMASSHGVETLDLKEPAFCPSCRETTGKPAGDPAHRERVG